MKLEKLLCLKYLGSRVVENLCESQTTKLFLPLLHETTESVAGSSTISNVFVRKGGGPTSCNPSLGRGEEEDDDEQPVVAVVLVDDMNVISSSFTVELACDFVMNSSIVIVVVEEDE